MPTNGGNPSRNISKIFSLRSKYRGKTCFWYFGTFAKAPTVFGILGHLHNEISILVLETPKLIMFIIWDFRTGHFLPKPIIFIFGDTRTPKTNQDIWKQVWKICLYISKKENRNSRNVWEHISKRRVPTNDEDPCKQIFKILDMNQHLNFGFYFVAFNRNL